MTPAEQLEYERQIAKVLAIRRVEKSEESTLKTWLNSNVLTALIGLIGTGILGVVVSGVIQDRSKQMEEERETRAAKASAQEVPVTKTLDLVGTFVNTTDDLLVGINRSYSEQDRLPHEIEALRKWKVQLTEKRDAADFAWRREERLLGYSLALLFDDDVGIRDAWKNLRSSVQKFEACTNQFYSANAATGTDVAVEKICPAERSACYDALERFLRAVLAAQQLFREKQSRVPAGWFRLF